MIYICIYVCSIYLCICTSIYRDAYVRNRPCKSIYILSYVGNNENKLGRAQIIRQCRDQLQFFYKGTL